MSNFAGRHIAPFFWLTGVAAARMVLVRYVGISPALPPLGQQLAGSKGRGRVYTGIDGTQAATVELLTPKQEVAWAYNVRKAGARMFTRLDFRTGGSFSGVGGRARSPLWRRTNLGPGNGCCLSFNWPGLLTDAEHIDKPAIVLRFRGIASV